MIRYLIALILCTLLSCRVPVDDKIYNSGIHVIPEPNEMAIGQGVFTIDGSTTIYTGTDEWNSETELLKGRLTNASGYDIKLSDKASGNSILLKKDKSLGREEYKVNVCEDSIELIASNGQGMF